MTDQQIGAADEREELQRQVAQLRHAINLDNELFLAGPECTLAYSSAFILDAPGDEQHVAVEVEPPSTSTPAFDHLTTIDQLRRCLDFNLEYQALIRDMIDTIRKAKVRIQLRINTQEEKIEMEKEARSKQVTRPIPVISRWGAVGIRSFRKPYFKYVFGLRPLANKDLVQKTYLGEAMSSDLNFSSGWLWYLPKWKEKFFREIRRGCLSKLLENQIKRRDELRELVQELGGEEGKEAEYQLSKAEKEIKKAIRESDDRDLFGNKAIIGRIDWTKVASNMGGIITPMTCQLVWMNYYSPYINKQGFTKAEDTKLTGLAEKYNCRNWLAVAKEMKHGRTAFQCLQRHQSKLVKKRLIKEIDEPTAYLYKLVWTVEDEQRLMEVVAAFDLSPAEYKCPGLYIDWQFVSQHVGQFSSKECSEKYLRLAEKLINGRWSKEEEDRLIEATKIHGTSKWTDVSSHVGTRGARQCQEHWWTTASKKCLIESLKTNPAPEWTAEEDAIIWFNRNSRSSRASNWREIQGLLPGRHRHELRLRYKLLHQWYDQAKWLVNDKGSLLSFLVTADADLTLAELRNVRKDFSRLTAKEASYLGAENQEQKLQLQFSQEGQLDRFLTTMVIGASLSHGLVRQKVELCEKIAAGKAVPVPVLRLAPVGEYNMERISHAFSKMKEVLIRATAARQKKDVEAWQKEVEAKLEEIASEGKGLKEIANSTFTRHPNLVRNFEEILDKISEAATVPHLAEAARQVFLKVEALCKMTNARKLLEASKALDKLSQQICPTNFGIQRDPDFAEYCCLNKALFRIRHIGLPSDGGTQKFHKKRPGNPKHGYIDEASKSLVLALGTNLEGVLAEASNQRDQPIPDDSAASDQKAKLQIPLYFDQDSSIDPFELRHMYAERAVKVLSCDIDEPSTSRGKWASIREEADDTLGCTGDDFANSDFAPIFPPSNTTVATYRLMTLSRLRLQDMVDESCSPTQRLQLAKKIVELKRHPTEGFALLQRRFESLFSWPAILAQVPPRVSKDRLPYKRYPPRTTADVLVPDWLQNGVDLDKSDDDDELRVVEMDYKQFKCYRTYRRSYWRDMPFAVPRAKLRRRRAYYKGRGLIVKRVYTSVQKHIRQRRLFWREFRQRSARINNLKSLGKIPSTYRQPNIRPGRPPGRHDMPATSAENSQIAEAVGIHEVNVSDISLPEDQSPPVSPDVWRPKPASLGSRPILSQFLSSFRVSRQLEILDQTDMPSTSGGDSLESAPKRARLSTEICSSEQSNIDLTMHSGDTDLLSTFIDSRDVSRSFIRGETELLTPTFIGDSSSSSTPQVASSVNLVKTSAPLNPLISLGSQYASSSCSEDSEEDAEDVSRMTVVPQRAAEDNSLTEAPAKSGRRAQSTPLAALSSLKRARISFKEKEKESPVRGATRDNTLEPSTSAQSSVVVVPKTVPPPANLDQPANFAAIQLNQADMRLIEGGAENVVFAVRLISAPPSSEPSDNDEANQSKI